MLCIFLILYGGVFDGVVTDLCGPHIDVGLSRIYQMCIDAKMQANIPERTFQKRLPEKKETMQIYFTSWFWYFYGRERKESGKFVVFYLCFRPKTYAYASKDGGQKKKKKPPAIIFGFLRSRRFKFLLSFF